MMAKCFGLLATLVVMCAQAIQISRAPIGETAMLDEEGYQHVAAETNDKEMQTFMERVIASEGLLVKDWAALKGTVPYYSGTKATRDLETMIGELRGVDWLSSGGGRTAPLTADGYKQVVSEKNNPQMKAFMRRVLDKAGLVVTDEASFNGIVPFYSGVVFSQKFSEMENELFTATWAVPLADWQGLTGKTAPLTDHGYTALAQKKSDDDMKIFIARLLSTQARHVQDESGLEAIVPFFSGTQSAQDLSALKYELRESKHKSWIADETGVTADLSEDGYNKVAALHSDVQMKAFIRRAIVNAHLRMKAEAGLSGFVPYYSGRFLAPQSYARMLQDLQDASWTEQALAENASPE